VSGVLAVILSAAQELCVRRARPVWVTHII